MLDLPVETTALNLLIAAGLGALIGLERELAGKDPSLRTFALISLGSCLFSSISWLSVVGAEDGDPSRIAAQIVTGIGFLGAGTIFRSQEGTRGLTTAALMWCTAGIGMAVGFNQVILAVCATLISVLITLSLTLMHQVIRSERSNGKASRPHDDTDERWPSEGSSGST
jgi:putative Mg2+ transporter-C (MgtC) family protein